MWTWYTIGSTQTDRFNTFVKSNVLKRFVCHCRWCTHTVSACSQLKYILQSCCRGNHLTNCEPEGPFIGLRRTPVRRQGYVSLHTSRHCPSASSVQASVDNFDRSRRFHERFNSFFSTALQQHNLELLTCYVFDQLFSTVSDVEAWILTKNLSPSLFMYLLQIYPSL